MFNYSVYDIVFQVDDYYFFDEVPFHLFLYEEDIEQNHEIMQFFLKSITSESHKYIAAYLNDIPFEFNEEQVQGTQPFPHWF